MSSPVRLIQRTRDTAGALEILDGLRKQIESGEIVAFAAVGTTSDDTVFQFTGTTETISRARVAGAIAALQHGFISDWS